MPRNFVKSNNTPLRGDNLKLLYNGQYKITTLIKQCYKFNYDVIYVARDNNI